ncbi:ABC transporter permease [Lachnospiraceae bacterium 54-11]
MLLLARIEFTKLKRCNVYIVGIVTLLFSTLISVFQQISLNEPIPHYGFYNLVNDTIWYNMCLFLSVTMIFLGGYMINREYTEDTLKNMFIVPVTYQTLICGKLIALAIMTMLYCGYSALVTILISATLFPEGLSLISSILEAGKIIIVGLCIYIAIMPVICWCCGRKNRFMAAAVLGFLYGFSGIPIAGHQIRNKVIWKDLLCIYENEKMRE